MSRKHAKATRGGYVKEKIPNKMKQVENTRRKYFNDKLKDVMGS